MAEITPLADAVAELVRDGDAVALEGFTHLIPFAAGHEVLRQGRRDLELIRMTPGRALRPDGRHGRRAQAGVLLRAAIRASARCTACATRSSTAGRAPVEIEEHSHAGMANRYAAGAAGLPCALMRGYARHRPRRRTRASSASRARSPARSWSRCRRCGRTSRSSTPRRPTAPATCSSGASPACRRRRCSPPERVAGHGRADRRRARAAARRDRHPGLGDRRGRRGAGRLAARPTRSASPSATTTSTASGTRSAATASASPRGWTSTCSAGSR